MNVDKFKKAKIVDMDKPEKEALAKCDGCHEAIYHMDENIVEVAVGFMDSDGLIQGTKKMWMGHKKCFDKRFKE